MRLIVGLGNPGVEYAKTRHNIGFMALQVLAEREGIAWRKSPVADGLAVKIDIDGDTCSLLLPLTYMNNSGVAVKAVMSKFEITPEDVLIVYDDIAVTFGDMRIRPVGGAGGHNGIKSIIGHLGTQNFARLRLGVSRPKPGLDQADYVLSDFTSAEQKLLPDFINQALLCVHSWVTEGVEQAMNQFNKKRNHDE